MVARQDRPAQIIKAHATTFAAVTLTVRLPVVTPIADHRLTGAAGTAYSMGPTMLTDQLKTLLVVNERGEINQL
jgi:hypothetical protein